MYTYDAPWHRGRDVADPYPISTERFVVRPRRRGRRAGPPCRHDRPFDGGAALVVSGRDRGPTLSAHLWSRTWHRISAAEPPGRGSRGCMRFRPNSIRPKRFTTSSGLWPASTSSRRSTGPRPAGACTDTPSDWIEIAAEWGTRDYWEQWTAVRVPALLIEAGNSVTPPGQMRRMAGNRLPDNVFARARRRSPGPRRCAADLPRCGRVVPSDARPWRLRRARTAAARSVCGSRRRRVRRGSRHGRPRTACPSSGRTNGTGRSECEASQSDGRPS